MNFYQKFYTNQIHSSSLLCQLATMWKSQVLCDAIIRTGPVITKAHRVVLVAACPMLQSMDNASMGNHLEVRLAADIKQDSINTFLQYLYEGFMMLTEENCRDVEKIARLLQVDSVIKCCADFQKCLNSVTGAPMSMDNQYKYTSYDMLEFRHVRSSNLQKSYHDRHMKRMSDFPRPSSPGSKRQRMAKPSSPLADSHSSSHRVIDDTLSMAHSYRSSAPDPWERIPRPGMNVSSRSGVSGQPGVIDIVEDCLEIIQTEDPEKDTRGNVKPDSRPKQKTVSIGVSSQINTNTDVHIVNVTEPGGSHGTAKPSATESARGSITVNPLSMFNDSASSSRDYGKQSIDPSVDVQMSPISLDTDHLQQKNESYVPTPPQQPVFPMMTPISQTTSKPFAAGSSTQISASSPAKVTENADPEQKQNEGDRDDSGDKSPSTSADKAPDISIVKIEAADGNTGGLDMYVDMPDEGSMRLKSGLDDTMDREDDSDTEHDQSQEWIREEMSNEGSNISGEQNNSWYIGQFKGMYESGQDASEVSESATGSTEKPQWGVKLFKEWLSAVNFSQNFETYTALEINELLCRFYLTLERQYNTVTMCEIRDSIFRHLVSIDVEWKRLIFSNTFQTSNDLIKSVSSRNTKPKPHSKVRMLDEDLYTLVNSGLLTNNNPLGLFRKVWFDLAVHLGIGGQAAMRALCGDSFISETDEKGRKYYRLNRKMNAEKSRSCMEMQYWNWEGRMYEVVDDPNCPVKTMDLYMEKRNPTKKAFFQRPKTNLSTAYGGVWFESPVGHSVLACMMSRMCEEAGLQRTYTNSSLRITLADFVERSGHDIEEILGNNPRNKSLKNTVSKVTPTMTSDELRNNSNFIHQLLYSHK